MKFRDTERSYNIIHHSKGLGLAWVHLSNHRDHCSLGHDLTLLRWGVVHSSPRVSLCVRSFLHSFILSFITPLLADHLLCARLCWPTDIERSTREGSCF